MLRRLPGWAVRLFAGPYIAGDSIVAALDVAAGLAADGGARATLDILGEEVRAEEEAAGFAALYEQTLHAISSDPRFATGATAPSLSFKPSALGRVLRREDGSIDEQGSDLDGCRARIRRVTELARELGVQVTLDMEDRHWTEFTVRTCETLRAEGFDNFGTVLQTRLHRTEADLERIPPGTRVRLVIGIYEEPPEAAILSRPEMKVRLVDYGRRLLERGVRVEMATHDEPVIRRFLDEVARPGGHGGDRVEFQFLLGVPRRKLQGELIAAGYPVRLYVPFATEWDDAIAYARRRLQENPDIVSYGLKNMLRIRNR